MRPRPLALISGHRHGDRCGGCDGRESEIREAGLGIGSIRDQDVGLQQDDVELRDRVVGIDGSLTPFRSP